MSRDWTPLEHYMVEQQHIKEGRGDYWDFLRGLNLCLEGQESQRMVSDDEIALRQQFPVFGKHLENFMELFGKIANFDNGLEFFKQKAAALAEYIATGKGLDDESYLVKWFEGRLDEHFYYRELNDELLVTHMCQEAALEHSNWCLTDSDCLQCRRQVEFQNPGTFELVQVDTYDLDGRKVYKLAVAEIDLTDYSDKERDSALNMYGYDNIKAFVSAVGSWEAAYGELAEMLFEISSAEHYVMEFQSWNDALAEVERRTGERLNAFRESDRIPLDDVIKEASSFQVSAQPEECGSIKDTELSER